MKIQPTSFSIILTQESDLPHTSSSQPHVDYTNNSKFAPLVIQLGEGIIFRYKRLVMWFKIKKRMAIKLKVVNKGK
jgi:hypothetical protein